MTFSSLPVVLSLMVTAAGARAAVPAPAAKPLKIMIDPGHGGVDTGAVAGAVREAEVALQVALVLKSKLDRDSRFEALLTRTRDTALSLPERVKRADDAKADLFMSIHANSSPDPRAKGAEFYFQNQLPPDEESLFLAAAENKLEKPRGPEDAGDLQKESDVRAILDDLKRQHRTHNSFQLTRLLSQSWRNNDHSESHAVRQAPFYVVARSERPAVLVELGFVTHPQEGPRLLRKEVQEKIAENLYQGLIRYANGLPSPTQP